MDNKEIIYALHEAEKKLKNCNNSLIGIGITTHNRYSIFQETYNKMVELLPPNAALVIVDDGSDSPVKESTYRFDKSVGIARAKNKCIELLYDKGCEHFFLFDDDCYPMTKDWYIPYINNSENHLNYIFMDFSNSLQFALKFTYMRITFLTWII